MQGAAETTVASQLAPEWGCERTIALYLNICQVDTPPKLVKATWDHVHQLRDHVGMVVDFGAGDGRFARYGRFDQYLGFEVDKTRIRDAVLPANAELLDQCAFSADRMQADLCIGNPPFVRNQHLPDGWRRSASQVIEERVGVRLSGLANAWQYFFFLALASTKPDGLCALVVPFEWVSRPSAKALRDYIKGKGWRVDVYRLVDSTFDAVLTTASITLIDKTGTDGRWRYFEETADGAYTPLLSPTGGQSGVIGYRRRSDVKAGEPRAMRGLSPGTQKLLTLTEGERVHAGLKTDRDVVPCITTLRHLPADVATLDRQAFNANYRDPGHKCWLIRTDAEPSQSLLLYLESTSSEDRKTATCDEREIWWRFVMPPTPGMLISQSFRGRFPKAVDNVIGAKAVGGVCGLYNINDERKATLASTAITTDLAGRIVAHSNGLRKIEINQLNMLLQELFSPAAAS